MIPTLFKMGPLSIHSYGLMLALAIIICSYLLGRDAQRRGISKQIIYDLVFWVVIAGILGARIFFIVLNFPFFQKYPLEMLMIQKGGLAWQGSLIFGSLAGGFFIKIRKLPFLEMLDLSAPYAALGQSIGRIGCFLNGCCYGRAVAWGIYFPVHHDRLHPTQLYSVFGLLLIYFILKRYQRTSSRAGYVFALYLFLASFLRFIIEFFRADHEIFFGTLSIYQCVTLFVASISLIFLFYIKKVRGE